MGSVIRITNIKLSAPDSNPRFGSIVGLILYSIDNKQFHWICEIMHTYFYACSKLQRSATLKTTDPLHPSTACNSINGHGAHGYESS